MDHDLLMLSRSGLTEKAIASALRNGPSQAFLNALATMFDPLPINWKHPPKPGENRAQFKRTRYRLRLQHADSNRPKGSTKADANALGEAMLALEQRRLPRGEAKAQKARILDEYGVGSRTAEKAKRRAREMNEVWDWLRAKEAK
jgi:hypothetical protein